MKSVTFVEGCTIYPDGETPVDVAKGATRALEDDYADLLVGKGHAEPARPVDAPVEQPALKPVDAPAVAPPHEPIRLDIPSPALPPPA